MTRYEDAGEWIQGRPRSSFEMAFVAGTRPGLAAHQRARYNRTWIDDQRARLAALEDVT